MWNHTNHTTPSSLGIVCIIPTNSKLTIRSTQVIFYQLISNNVVVAKSVCYLLSERFIIRQQTIQGHCGKAIGNVIGVRRLHTRFKVFSQSHNCVRISTHSCGHTLIKIATCKFVKKLSIACGRVKPCLFKQYFNFSHRLLCRLIFFNMFPQHR